MELVEDFGKARNELYYQFSVIKEKNQAILDERSQSAYSLAPAPSNVLSLFLSNIEAKH